jgi:hypothetical protein
MALKAGSRDAKAKGSTVASRKGMRAGKSTVVTVTAGKSTVVTVTAGKSTVVTVTAGKWKGATARGATARGAIGTDVKRVSTVRGVKSRVATRVSIWRDASRMAEKRWAASDSSKVRG